MTGILKSLICGLAAILILGPVDGHHRQALAGDPVVLYTDNDPEMNAAIDGARATLDGFLDKYFSGALQADGASLKVAIPTPTGGAEHIFLVNIEKLASGQYQGSIDNDPHNLPDLKLGDRYTFDHGQISDWNYWEGGRLHGSYTLRAMLPRLPQDQADEFRAMLAPLE